MMALSMSGSSTSRTEGTVAQVEMSKTPSQPQPNFAEKLHYLLTSSEYQHIMQWNYLGDSFVILDTNKFLDTVMPSHFGRSNHGSSQFDSFARRMRRWGFRRADSPEEKQRGFVVFKCKLFRRDEPDLCKMMCDERKLKKKDGMRRSLAAAKARVVYHAPVQASRVKENNTNKGHLKPSSANVPRDSAARPSSKRANMKFSQQSLQAHSPNDASPHLHPALKSPASHRVQYHIPLGTTHAVGHSYTTGLVHSTPQLWPHSDGVVAAQEMNRSIPMPDAYSQQSMDRYQLVYPNYWRGASQFIVPEDRRAVPSDFLRRTQVDFRTASRNVPLTAVEYEYDMHPGMGYRHTTPVYQHNAKSVLYPCLPLASHEDTMISSSSTTLVGRFHGKDVRQRVDLTTRTDDFFRAVPTPSYHRRELGRGTHPFDAPRRV